MYDIQVVYDAFSFMRLVPKDNIEQVRRQYRDLMILWHPDKHFKDKSKYMEYEKLTKQLNAAYGIIVEYLNSKNTLPPREMGNEGKAFNILDLSAEAFVPLKTSKYYSDLGIACVFETAFFNGVSQFINLVGSLDKWILELRAKSINALVENINAFKLDRNTIRFGCISYSRKVDFVVLPYDNESIFSKLSRKRSYLSNTGRYLDYLNANTFSGINKWRMISAEDLYALFCFGRSQGYNVGDGKLYAGRDSSGYRFKDYCTFNGRGVRVSDLSHVPLNGGRFIDFLGTIGFYCIDKRFCYYQYQDEVFKLDLENCCGSELVNDDDEPFLWPVSNEIEGIVATCITHISVKDSPAVSNATRNKAFKDLKTNCLWILVPFLIVGTIILVILGLIETLYRIAS